MLTAEQLRPILENRYNRDDWYNILRQNFNAKTLREAPVSLTSINGNEFDAKAYILGELDTTDGYKVGIYEVDTPGVKQIYRNKVGLRNLLKNVYQSDVDAALIVFTQGDKWRFSYVSEITSRNPETGERLSVKTESKRYTYLFGKDEKVKTASDRFAQVQQEDRMLGKGTTLKALQDTFSVEKMSKDFFNEYRKHYGAFLSYLIGENEDGKTSGIASPLFKTIFNTEDKKARDFVKKMLGRIVFLYFLEKKGWMGVPQGEKWGKGDSDFLRNLFNDCKDQNGFYPLILEPLFHKTLNEEREGDFFSIDASLFDRLGYDKLRIPFLNGGLFEPENYNTDFLVFPGDLFKNLFEFFDRYNFTVHEDSPEEHTVAVDPEMLGHIFENLLEDNKDKGAFYTPKEVVHYMCQESLIEYLYSKCKTTFDANLRDSLENFIKHQELSGIADYKEAILVALRDVKICDPAIGSGAFPMAILLEIFHSIETLYYDATEVTERIWCLNGKWDPAKIKLRVIENSIYGVDLEPGAVDIARLRFWLSLVVDEENPKPLPNLDYKIMQGNSLLESFEDIDLCVKVDKEDSLFRDETKFSLSDIAKLKAQVKNYFKADTQSKKAILQRSINQVINKFIAERIIEKQRRNDEATNDASNSLILEGRRSPTTDALKSKQEHNLKKLRSVIEKLIKESENIQELQKNLSLMQQTKIYPYFLWHLWFSDVFDEGGFDIVIGNPPYIQLQKDGGKLAKIYEKCGFLTFESTGDIYSLFYEKGYEILKPKGYLIYITSNKWMRAGYGASTRKFLTEKTNPLLLIDFAGQKIFESATVDTNILLFSKDKNQQQTLACLIKEKLLKKLSVFVRQRAIICKFNSENSWVISNLIEQRIKAKVESAGIPLKQWDINIYRGVLTGYNEAFIIDGNKKDELIIADPKSAEIIRPILRGRDIKRYGYDFADLWLIDVHNGIKEKGIKPIEIECYPSIKKHLDLYYLELEKRTDKGDTPYNLRNCAYTEDFSKQKIIYPEITKFLNFYYDTNAFYVNNKCFILTGNHIYFLTAFLNSSLFKFCFKNNFPELLGGTRELRKIFMEEVPIIKIDDFIEKRCKELINQICSFKAQRTPTKQIEIEIDDLIFNLYKLSQDEKNEIGFIEI